MAQSAKIRKNKLCRPFFLHTGFRFPIYMQEIFTAVIVMCLVSALTENSRTSTSVFQKESVMLLLAINFSVKNNYLLDSPFHQEIRKGWL